MLKPWQHFLDNKWVVSLDLCFVHKRIAFYNSLFQPDVLQIFWTPKSHQHQLAWPIASMMWGRVVAQNILLGRMFSNEIQDLWACLLCLPKLLCQQKQQKCHWKVERGGKLFGKRFTPDKGHATINLLFFKMPLRIHVALAQTG